MVKLLLSARLAEKRWTKEDLARETGIDLATIKSLTEENPRQIELRHLDAICGVLGCGVGDLMRSFPDGDTSSES